MIPSPRLLRCWRQIWIVAGKSLSLTTSARTLKIQKMPASGETEDCPVTKAPRLADVGKPVLLKFSKLTDDAFTPTKGSKQAAGYDLYSAYDYAIEPKGKVLAKTDLQIALPDGCYGRIAPRSGLAHKHFIDVGAGVIDQDYRGNVGVILFNFGIEEFKVQKGDRIAQLILERIYLPELMELDSLNDTERGEGGFGSSGKN